MKKKFRSDSGSMDKKPAGKFFEWSLLSAVFFILLFSCNTAPSEKAPAKMSAPAEIYYCPMHPEIQQDHPGICMKPECKGMPLVKKVSEDVLSIVLRPVNSSVLAALKTIHPEEKETALDFEAQGYIDYNNNTKHNIASRLNGRIEKLYVKYNYQAINKGSRIFDLYSPELITAQENLVYLLNTDAVETDLINASKEKLTLLGFTEGQISALVRTRKVQNSIPVLSKWDGHIHEMLSSGSERDATNEMNSMTEENINNSVSAAGKNKETSELSIKEGMYVTRGQTIFNVVDPHEVSVMLQIRAEDISKVKLNQTVELRIDETPEMKMTGKINFIEPFLKARAKTLTARVDISNSEHKHKIGTLVKAMIKGGSSEGLWIPSSAVINLGKKKMVWLKKDGYFIARTIETGSAAQDWIEVYDGITQKDEIAAEAHYLSDSESFIKINEDK